jgi:EpsD family peptidyl-prolyl cis-trans isomerase
MHRLNMLAGCALLSLFFVTGCNSDKSADLKPAALINGQVIAAEQIQAESGKLGQGDNGQNQMLANLILKNVINQELLAQEAVKAKLNEKSDIAWKLEEARREILAQAQLEAMTRNVATPAQTDIKTYYDGHPELFSHHKIYQIANLVADTTPQNLDKARELIQKNKDAKSVAAALKGLGVTVSGQQVVKGAEALPKEALDKFATMQAGQSLVMEQSGKLNIVILEGVKEQSITLEQATPAIGMFLSNDRKRQLMEAQVNKLRQQAKIEYKSPYTAAEMGKN